MVFFNIVSDDSSGDSLTNVKQVTASKKKKGKPYSIRHLKNYLLKI